MARHLILSATPLPDLPGGPDLPGSVGGLGYSYDLRRARKGAIRIDPIAAHTPADPGFRLKRTLLFAVRAGAPADPLEAALLAMPRHIPAIRAWALSRLDHPTWTHAWEQMFTGPDDLTAYLAHPYHWTHVDTFFDPLNPRAVVEPRLVHIYREADPTTLES